MQRSPWSLVLAALLGLLHVVIVDVHSTRAQSGPPPADIYLVEMSVRSGLIVISGLRNITARAGYDNQPSFAPDGESIFFTSYRDDGQADIYRYEIASGKITAFTETPESEYSADVTPSGTHVSVVRVEADSTQRMWLFPLDGKDDPTPLFEHQTGVGYYCWGNDKTVALFVLGEPNALYVGDVPSGRTGKLIDEIGRSLQDIPGVNAISFVGPGKSGDPWVQVLYLETGATEPLVKALEESLDCAWAPNGILLMAQGSKLYQWNPSLSAGWREVHDFSEQSVRGISRIAVSPSGTHLAFVAEDEAKPE